MENKKSRTIEIFNQSAEYYDDTYNGRHARKVKEIVLASMTIRMGEKGSMLDIGCGTGDLIRSINLRKSKWDYYGVDISENMLRVSERNRRKNEKFCLADAEKLPFDNERFDFVTCTDSFHHYTHPEAAVCEMYRVLKEGMTLIMSEIWLPFVIRHIVNVFLKLLNNGDVKVYSKKDIVNMLKNAGFREVKFRVKTLMIYECIAQK